MTFPYGDKRKYFLFFTIINKKLFTLKANKRVAFLTNEVDDDRTYLANAFVLELT